MRVYVTFAGFYLSGHSRVSCFSTWRGGKTSFWPPFGTADPKHQFIRSGDWMPNAKLILFDIVTAFHFVSCFSRSPALSGLVVFTCLASSASQPDHVTESVSK